jgi:hypothetical protein
VFQPLALTLPMLKRASPGMISIEDRESETKENSAGSVEAWRARDRWR